MVQLLRGETGSSSFLRCNENLLLISLELDKKGNLGASWKSTLEIEPERKQILPYIPKTSYRRLAKSFFVGHLLREQKVGEDIDSSIAHSNGNVSMENFAVRLDIQSMATKFKKRKKLDQKPLDQTKF